MLLPPGRCFIDMAAVFCAAGFWCSLSTTKYAWNSSRAAPRTATLCPASARTTACWRCRYPHRHSDVSSPLPLLLSNAQSWRWPNLKPPNSKTLDSRAFTLVPTLSPKMGSYLAFCCFPLVYQIYQDSSIAVTMRHFLFFLAKKALIRVACHRKLVKCFTGVL